MCGIIGYIGSSDKVTNRLINGLKKLEYRGYDSAGIAVIENGVIRAVKSVGRVDALEKKLPILSGTSGIGHTRWATNGVVNEQNCHPIMSQSGKFAVVHNGIIENALEIRKKLEKRGFVFSTDTDTESVAQLIEYHYLGDGKAALESAYAELEGSCALAVLCSDFPNSIFVAKKKSPLAVGYLGGETLIASDANVLPPEAKKVILSDGQVMEIKVDCSEVASPILGKETSFVCKDGYPHFMLKEIYEQPDALRATLLAPLPRLGRFNEVTIIACGSSYNVAKTAKPFFEARGIRTHIEYASEYRYSAPIKSDALAVFVSQSGETADTLAGEEEAKRRGQKTLGIVNVEGSALTRACDFVLPTVAGAEIAVATTKGFTSQLAALYRLALLLSGEDEKSLKLMPRLADEMLSYAPKLKRLAKRISKANDVYFVGRGADYGVALEGALKLKEISYIHAEAYPAGELKHGAISLIEQGLPLIASSVTPANASKTLLTMRTVHSRGGYVACVTNDPRTAEEADYAILLPPAPPEIAPLAATIAFQFLAYYAADYRGCDIDKPRNLAKSVTVE